MLASQDMLAPVSQNSSPSSFLLCAVLFTPPDFVFSGLNFTKMF